MEYEGPAFRPGDRVRWLSWKNNRAGFPSVRHGWVRRIVEPARSAHGPRLLIDVDPFWGEVPTAIELLPHLHGVRKLSAIDALAQLMRNP